jgi:hypothetical protein
VSFRHSEINFQFGCLSPRNEIENDESIELENEEEESRTLSTSAATISVTSSVVAQLEPMLLRMRLLQMVNNTSQNVQSDHRHALLPDDSLETIFTNSTSLQGTSLPLPPPAASRTPLVSQNSDRTATTYQRFGQGLSDATLALVEATPSSLSGYGEDTASEGNLNYMLE